MWYFAPSFAARTQMSFRSSSVDGGQDVVGLLDVDEDVRRVLGASEQRLITVEDAPHDAVGGRLVELRVAARLVDDDETPSDEVVVDVVGVVGRRRLGVLGGNASHQPRTVGIVEHLEDLLEVVVRPRPRGAASARNRPSKSP